MAKFQVNPNIVTNITSHGGGHNPPPTIYAELLNAERRTHRAYLTLTERFRNLTPEQIEAYLND
jgi:hypothetical protein